MPSGLKADVLAAQRGLEHAFRAEGEHAPVIRVGEAPAHHVDEAEEEALVFRRHGVERDHA
jgi:hypothetical protein